MRRTLLLLSTMAFALLLAGGVAAAATFSFSNSSTITINDNAVATPYPSTIEVSNVSPASVQDVNLTLKGFSHTCPADVGVLLVGPQGQNAVVMSDVGGCAPGVNNIDLTFDDEATGFVPDAPTTGSYKPTAGPNAVFPSPAPSGPYGTALSVFDGTNPNGTWSLYVIDDASGDTGSISGGWSLDISATPPADTTAPFVTETSPEGTNVSKTADVTAKFSEKVENVTTDTFILERRIAAKGKNEPPKFERIAATVTPSADGLTAVLDPVENLATGVYRVTITTAVTDTAGNPLDQESGQEGNQPMVWTFTVKK